MAAADELAQTGECDPKEIYNEAQELEERMSSFLAALARRRSSLDMTVSFYSHVHAVSILHSALAVYKFYIYMNVFLFLQFLSVINW